jgi:8-oxo-dGTP pyrophosphatase MutT (NUDIX family)
MMSATELRERLARLVGDEQPGKLVRGGELQAALTAPPIPAAVLVPFVMREEPALLLTKRNERLKRHAGQVSFPGGRIDPGDVDATAAALREAEEEIGLVPMHVEVLGRLGDFLTGTGFRITPVVGLIPPGLPLRPDAHEVDAVFEFPVETLLDPAAPRRERQERRGVVRDVWIWPHPDHYIWGATAAIMVRLAERLRDGE